MNESVPSRPARPEDSPAAARPWLVLVVDDEPEIHEITKLVLADVSFSGRRVEFHSAYSAAEAKAFLQRQPDTALVLLDVVMETEDAGLGLVRHVRDELNNAEIQLVLRTGQPGMAPERDVILRYEINGYFLKTEITAQKLYSIVISALRAFEYMHSPRQPTRQTAGPSGPAARGLRQQQLQDSLLRAIEHRELYLHARPEVRLSTDTIVGVELLPSWKTAEGILGHGQIAEILYDPQSRERFDLWLLRQACSWSRSWRALQSPPLRVCVPMLTDRIWDPGVLTMIEECFAEFEITSGGIDLELPEAALRQMHPRSRAAFAALQAKGASVTLADFGSGMISLPFLFRLLPDRVKIHRSFVRNVAGDRERSAIARSIIALAHTLGLGVVADGIATELDLQFFKWEGCDFGQGELLTRTVDVAEVAEFLASKRASTH